MKATILKILKEAGGYVSGQQLCEELGVSRTAIWKAVNRLKEEGYQVEAVRNKGYHIVDSPNLVTAEEISSVLKTKWAGAQIHFRKEVDSTNIWAKRLGEEGAPNGTAVIADVQHSGRGRRGRAWFSPAGANIYMSILLRPEIMPDKAPMLTLVMAYSVAQAIRETEELNVKIKWPNDIILDRRKVCGILTEMNAEADYIHHVVIGVGINVNGRSSDLPEDFRDHTIFLSEKQGQAINRARLAAAVLKYFEQNYEQFLADGDLSGIIEQYNELLINKDREVRVLIPGQEYEAFALGINRKGELLVRRPSGETEEIFAGEVSVRGVYGYV